MSAEVLRRFAVNDEAGREMVCEACEAELLDPFARVRRLGRVDSDQAASRHAGRDPT